MNIFEKPSVTPLNLQFHEGDLTHSFMLGATGRGMSASMGGKGAYMYDELRFGGVPTKDQALKILADYDDGHVFLAPICEPGAIERLRTIAAGGEVDQIFP